MGISCGTPPGLRLTRITCIGGWRRTSPQKEEREAFLALGPESPAREIEPGQFFGEIGLFLGEPFEAVGVKAVSEVEILEITAGAMRQILQDNPEIAPRLATNVSAHLRRKRRTAISPSAVQNKMQEMLG